MAKLLTVQNVSKIFGSEGLRKKDVTVAVDHVTFSLADDRPTITATAGESGSGKSTLALLMMGQIPPNSGQVMYRGKDLARMSVEEKRALTREVQPIADAMEKVGLRPMETLGRYPHQLSGGQRLMVARALLCRPKVVMADEPVSMVDASLRVTILSSLRKLKQDFGISILYITHDLTTAYQISENILIMYAGSVVEAGSVEQVIRNPKHPYTQLLVSSIPLPDKNKRWGGVEIEEVQNRQSTGCKFAPRCPAVMEKCWSQRPAYYIPRQTKMDYIMM